MHSKHTLASISSFEIIGIVIFFVSGDRFDGNSEKIIVFDHDPPERALSMMQNDYFSLKIRGRCHFELQRR